MNIPKPKRLRTWRARILREDGTETVLHAANDGRRLWDEATRLARQPEVRSVFITTNSSQQQQ